MEIAWARIKRILGRKMEFIILQYSLLGDVSDASLFKSSYWQLTITSDDIDPTIFYVHQDTMESDVFRFSWKF